MSTYSSILSARRTPQQWEQQFSQWAQAPTQGEQERSENAIRAIKNAIARSSRLRDMRVKVFVQGSYRNRVNVRKESDVDVGVMCHEFFKFDLPAGRTHTDFGIELSTFRQQPAGYGQQPQAYSHGEFKDELEAALVDYFGREYVKRGNKAFDVRASSYRFDADVVPLIEFRQYWDNGSYRAGCALFPDRGGRIENYPERLMDYWPNTPLHYENGVSKNESTNRRFKSVVRILKCLRNEMNDKGISAAKSIPGYLLECLAWNVPDGYYGYPNWTAELRNALAYLLAMTADQSECKEWTEVDGIKYLFHGSQPWTRQQAHDFVNAAWHYLGFGD